MCPGVIRLTPSSSTGGHSLIERPCCRTLRLQQSSQRITNDLNSLPEGAVLAKDVNEFKSKIDQHWNHEVIYDYYQLSCQFWHILGWPNCATLSFVGNSYYKIKEACTIKYAYLIYTSFLHSTAIYPYSNPTSYYDTRSLCKHGKLKSAILGVTYFCQVSDVTLFPRKNSKLRPRIIFILGFNNIQLS